MKQILEPLENFYKQKRTLCFSSVGSFKYPYTKLVRQSLPAMTKIISKVTDVVQVIRLYEMSYVVVWTVDNVADEGEINAGRDHLTSMIQFLNSDRHPQNHSETILQYIFDAAALSGRDVEAIRIAFENIFQCVALDTMRRHKCFDGTPELWSQEDVERYVYQMEFDGIFKLIFELFGENTHDFKRFWPIVHAGRLHFYLLRDVVEDISQGLINVPKEFLPNDIHTLIQACKELEKKKDKNMHERIKKIKNLTNQFPEIEQWVTIQIREGQRLLTESRQVSQRGLQLRTKILLHGSRRRTQKFFKQASKGLL
ncbi:MAG: hypothetical protein ACI9VM_000680 [Candidatus Azotimanducaceae bacterium]|jgi:hypothetical protein